MSILAIAQHPSQQQLYQAHPCIHQPQPPLHPRQYMFLEQELSDPMQKARLSSLNANCYDSRGSLDELNQMHHPGAMAPPGPVPVPGPGPAFNSVPPPSMRHHQPFIPMSSSEMDDQECKVINEFCHLLEKSKQLFNGLR